MKHDVYDSGASATAERSIGSQGRAGSAPQDADKQEMMRRVQEAGSPGAGHKALEHFAGDWQADVKCWMDPNGAPEQSRATARAAWIMGGRFLQEEFQGQMMGKPFNGRTLLGYNNVKKAYQSVWVDDMSTGMFVSEGQGDGKQITLEGHSSCAATGRTNVPMRIVMRVISPDKHTFEMFDGSRGYARTLEITYTRS
jgi:hypothetical protein